MCWALAWGASAPPQTSEARVVRDERPTQQSPPEQEAKKACQEMWMDLEKFHDDALEVLHAESDSVLMWQSGRRGAARDRAQKALPAAERVISSAQRIQKQYQSKSFSPSLPPQAREILEAYSSAEPYEAELEQTRASAVAALAKRGDISALGAMVRLEDTKLK